MGNNKNKPKRPGVQAPGVNFQQRKAKGKQRERESMCSTPVRPEPMEQRRHSFSDFNHPGLTIPGPLFSNSPTFKHSSALSLGPSNSLHDLNPQGVMHQGLTPQSLPPSRSPALEMGLGSTVALLQHQLQHQLQLSQRQVDQLLGDLQACKLNLTMLCSEHQVLQAANAGLMAENEAMKMENHQLLEQAGQLEKQKNGLNGRLQAQLGGEKVDFDRTYAYDRTRMVELAQLISRHIKKKPREIDANRIHGCLRRCAAAAEGQPLDNPKYFAMDLLMLMATARACNWWTGKQLATVGDWLALAQSLKWQPDPPEKP